MAEQVARGLRRSECQASQCAFRPTKPDAEVGDGNSPTSFGCGFGTQNTLVQMRQRLDYGPCRCDAQDAVRLPGLRGARVAQARSQSCASPFRRAEGRAECAENHRISGNMGSRGIEPEESRWPISVWLCGSRVCYRFWVGKPLPAQSLAKLRGISNTMR